MLQHHDVLKPSDLHKACFYVILRTLHCPLVPLLDSRGALLLLPSCMASANLDHWHSLGNGHTVTELMLDTRLQRWKQFSEKDRNQHNDCYPRQTEIIAVSSYGSVAAIQQ